MNGARQSLTLGIRREDKNAWERRAPLTPDQVRVLTTRGLSVVVQPSESRIFADSEYQQAGAAIGEDLSACNAIFAVKEVPTPRIIPGKTYAFFPHVTKGQVYNLSMLRRILDVGCSLIDYEQIVDGAGKRLVFFGLSAGQAGMIDALWALGQRFEVEGRRTPFSLIRQAWKYPSLDAALADVRELGARIAADGLPEGLGPIVVGFTGSGHCTQGALSVFDLLPNERIAPHELSRFPGQRRRLGKVLFKRQERISRRDASKPFDMSEYELHPDRYQEHFERYLPFLSVLVNGVFWAPQYPRLVTREAVHRLFSQASPPRLRVIADISCDVGGSIECTLECTTPGAPIYVYEPTTERINVGATGHGPVILAVDNLPAELPRESSTAFGEQLLPFVANIVAADYAQEFARLDVPTEISRAMIAHGGKLMPRFGHLERGLHELSRTQSARPGRRNKVLVLGAGFVSGPLIRYLLKHQFEVTVADKVATRADQALSGSTGRGRAVALDVQNSEGLDRLVGDADLVVSLLPNTLHPLVARLCINRGVSLVTTSYITNAMRALDREARQRGVLLLNEVGLDPGLDHMLTMKVVGEHRSRGDVLTSLTCWCGGLPSPSFNNNPLGYKLSWYPRGALLAARTHAEYLKYGAQMAPFERCWPIEPLTGSAKTRYLKAGNTMHLLPDEAAVPVTLVRPKIALAPIRRAEPERVEIEGLGAFEGYPNGDSVSYLDTYNLPGSVSTILRGTLRYPGYGRIFSNLLWLGMFDELPVRPLAGLTCRTLLDRVAGGNTVEILRGRCGEEESAAVLAALTHLGFMDATPIELVSGSIMDVLLERMDATMQYEKDEEDMVVMRHEFIFELPEGGIEKETYTLVVLGDPGGDTAMARTVALPAAIAVRNILDGVIRTTGVLAPVSEEIYRPILLALEPERIVFQESKTTQTAVVSHDVPFPATAHRLRRRL